MRVYHLASLGQESTGMSKRLSDDIRSKVTVQYAAGKPVTIVMKRAGHGDSKGRIVGDRQYPICRDVERSNDRPIPGPACPPRVLHGRRRLAGLARGGAPAAA